MDGPREKVMSRSERFGGEKTDKRNARVPSVDGQIDRSTGRCKHTYITLTIDSIGSNDSKNGRRVFRVPLKRVAYNTRSAV